MKRRIFELDKKYYGIKEKISLKEPLIVSCYSLVSSIITTFILGRESLFIIVYLYAVTISAILISFSGYFYFKKMYCHRFKIIKKSIFLLSVILVVILASPFILIGMLLDKIGKIFSIEQIVKYPFGILFEAIMYLHQVSIYLTLIQTLESPVDRYIVVPITMMIFILITKVITWFMYCFIFIGKKQYYFRFVYSKERRAVAMYVYFFISVLHSILADVVEVESIIGFVTVFLLFHSICEQIHNLKLQRHINPILLNIINELEFLSESTKTIKYDQTFIMHVRISIKKYEISTYMQYIENNITFKKNRYKYALVEIKNFLNKSYMMKENYEELDNDISKLLNDISYCFIL